MDRDLAIHARMPGGSRYCQSALSCLVGCNLYATIGCVSDRVSPDGRDRFAEWLAALADRRARAFAVVRIGRMGGGAFGDCKPMGGGVWEARIDYGPGYRVYYARAGGRLILLLTGGDKRRQDADIARAIDYWQDWQRRNAS